MDWKDIKIAVPGAVVLLVCSLFAPMETLLAAGVLAVIDIAASEAGNGES